MRVLQSVKTKMGNDIELITADENISESVVLVIGVFHGDEPQGKYLIDKYLTFKYVDCPSPYPSPQGGEGYYKAIIHSHDYTNFSQKFAKILRLNSTDAEKRLWSVLRANRLYGYHFKRQKPIGNYVADFVCLKYRLVIEVDGGQHNSLVGLRHDSKRTEYLESQGYKVLRFWNNEIFDNIDGVIEKILITLEEQASTLAPLGRGIGRGAFNKLLFIPCLNPDGMQLNQRTNANGVDLNRNFPTKNWGEDTSKAGSNPANYFGGPSPASEIETKFVVDIIEEYNPKLIISLHAPYKIVNYDGPAEEIAQKISNIIGYPVEASIGYPTPGSFGTYCGVERNIPTITLELDEDIPVEELEKPIFEIFDELL